MHFGSELLLVGAVLAVGVLHTLVPDHWVPIMLIARQEGWSRPETARAALLAGTGHAVSTLLIGLVAWIAGVVIAVRFGTVISMLSSLALMAFGTWIALSSLRELDGHPPPMPDSLLHERTRPRSTRTALLLIVGSSPMVEGIPAFFAAAKYGPALVGVMALVFALATISTYVLLCVSSVVGLRGVRVNVFERYGEVVSGATIALVGLVFLILPML